MGLGGYVELSGLVGSVTRYYNAAAINQEAGAVAIIMLSLCVAGAVIGLIWKWRREAKDRQR